MSYNKCIFVGNLTRDVELRMLPSGVAVGELSLAVNRTWKNDAGEKQEEVSFFSCIAFGQRAETLAEYVKKGHAVLLETRAKQEVWDDKKTGEKRYAVKFIIESFTFLPNGTKRSAPSDNDEAPPARPKPAAAQTTAKAKAENPPVEDDEDSRIPF